MANCKIICEIPNKEIIYLDCEYQNIKEELQKKKNNLNQDSIILIDISETVYQATKINNNLMRDQMYFKVYDANQLQGELKEMGKIKIEQEKLINQENTLLQSRSKEFHLEAVSKSFLRNTFNQMEQNFQHQLSQLSSQLQLNAYNNHMVQMKNLENIQSDIQIVENQVQSSKKETHEQQQSQKQIKQKSKNHNSEISSKQQEDQNAILLSKEVQGKLIEAERKLRILAEEMKEKEKQHYMEIQELSENNRTQSANILRTKQAEMEKTKAEKQKQIQEIQDRYDRLELELNLMNTRCRNQEQQIQQLEEDNQQFQKYHEIELQKKNEDLMIEMQKTQQYQQYLQQLSEYCLVSQFEQQKLYIQQMEQLVKQQQVDLEEEQQYFKNERDKLKQLLKTEKERLLIANESNYELESTVSKLNDKIKQLDRELKRSKYEIGELEGDILQLKKQIENLQKLKIV
ncbi:unnamed protein product (macronuclear) [Paramecium tetraurelia]|uniref:Uncharacterized protein n=1 Tax=Paramecium tetraurelia TaxID=5888 RepID=A0DWS9_PARTE|nr:uncharacterized protein GSPATT00021139001 [Paramecium tetraurelia]CAK87496.1 unnamed protein product [Paramecium tetraurelia]|eukprot:XP_001454893.1 hypothetical protein (macronuclear) [Paramecium tetraurelia strain d4-2]